MIPYVYLVNTMKCSLCNQEGHRKNNTAFHPKEGGSGNAEVKKDVVVKKDVKKTVKSSSDNASVASTRASSSTTSRKKEAVIFSPPRPGVIRFSPTAGKYKVFANSHKSDIVINEKVYPTVEHYVTAMKFIDTDAAWAEEIRTAKNILSVRSKGRTKGHAGDMYYENKKIDYMRASLYEKFTQNDEMKKLLLGTKEAELEEESEDIVWGVGIDGTGENLTGQLLIELRDILREDDD